MREFFLLISEENQSIKIPLRLTLDSVQSFQGMMRRWKEPQRRLEIQQTSYLAQSLTLGVQYQFGICRYLWYVRYYTRLWQSEHHQSTIVSIVLYSAVWGI